MAESAAVLWVVGVESERDQVPAGAWVVVGMGRGGIAPWPVAVCLLGAHADRVACEYARSERSLMLAVVASLCCCASRAFGLACASVAA